ncbi:MAG TPA: molybdate ABC transporter permease subunit, partial [Cytophagales bacterium]|nr:molybdate ABC transporter permease subunit [Cytophagales bacterium]
MDWAPLILTFQLAALTTLCLLILGLPLALALAYRKFRLKPVVETLVSMPLVLPPTVLGFYILLAFSPQNGLGGWLRDTLGPQLVFTFEGLVLASIIYSLPFMVQPLQAGFSQVPASLREAAS